MTYKSSTDIFVALKSTQLGRIVHLSWFGKTIFVNKSFDRHNSLKAATLKTEKMGG